MFIEANFSLNSWFLDSSGSELDETKEHRIKGEVLESNEPIIYCIFLFLLSRSLIRGMVFFFSQFLDGKVNGLNLSPLALLPLDKTGMPFCRLGKQSLIPISFWLIQTI